MAVVKFCYEPNDSEQTILIIQVVIVYLSSNVFINELSNYYYNIILAEKPVVICASSTINPVYHSPVYTPFVPPPFIPDSRVLIYSNIYCDSVS